MKRFTSWLMLFFFAAVMSFAWMGCKPKDTTIQTEVTNATAAYPGVSVTVNEGVVTLNGEVENETVRSNAEADAKKVKGVKSVVNNLTVAPPPPPVVISSDDSLRNAVNALINNDYKDVNVQVNDGVVTLTGTIERSKLQDLMQKVNEMKPKKVENQLTIK